MNYQGTQILPHPRSRVWNALLDPVVLRASLAGCESFERTAETTFACKFKVTVGPVSARFAGTVAVADLDPPHALTLQFSGQGGVAGFGKGQAHVKLDELEGGDTRLDWTAEAQVGGKLAQLGSRLIEGSVRKMSAEFFERFGEQLSQPRPCETARDIPTAAEVQQARPANESIPLAHNPRRWAWCAVLLLAAGGFAAWQWVAR